MDAPDSTATLALGVAAGLTAAAASAVSYLVSRHHSRGGHAVPLLVRAHALMGVACLPLAWGLWPGALPPAGRWLPPLVGSAGCYLAGQAAVFAALRLMPASRLAPLLGLKLVMLAVIVSCLPGRPLDPRQWAAVGLSVVAAGLLGRGRAGATARALPIVLGGCLVFAVSDLCIVGLIDALQDPGTACCPRLGRLHAGAFAMAITYVLCGVAALPLLPRTNAAGLGGWGAAAQYAAAWLGGMVALYACFGLVGAVFGNILQSTRGVMSVVIGAGLAHLGWHDLEERVDRATFLRRLAAAALMTAAIALYAVDLA